MSVEQFESDRMCEEHALVADAICERCQTKACALCVAHTPRKRLCSECHERTSRFARAFFQVRVSVLLFVLCLVCVWGWRDHSNRENRKAWDHTLQVAIVLLREDDVDDQAVNAFRRRLSALDERLQIEMERYRPNAPRPFAFTSFGPVDISIPPPATNDDGLMATVSQNIAQWHYMRRIDARAGVEAHAFDSRIYVVMRKPATPETQMVEGASEQNGRIGTVRVELDVNMVDCALFVVGHELMHTLGASDKYDAKGHTLIPLGLAEPAQVPRFPQRYAEIMARNRALSETEERIPESVNELRVGPTTAAEVGWAQ